jgi:hypothetical protein
LERSDNVADRGHAFAVLKRGYPPPRGGGKSKEKSGFRSAERGLRSLLRQIPAIPMEFLEEDMVFIGNPDRLLPHLSTCQLRAAFQR